ncbi:Carbohydrate binding family 6 [Haliangium ochraceum DSM 14365]|uniref:Carbohydrate binding family 6 n=2 Tax=Haliangium ochraceum TaxID=80816 RepID=D0LM75_HALO1|nr:Carbohydrate binding family 6 [Haliangium ochraceum DSM 14365]
MSTHEYRQKQKRPVTLVKFGVVAGVCIGFLGTASAQTRLPAQIEAEAYSAQQGVQFEATSDAGGGQNAGWIDAGDWLSYSIDVPAAGTYILEYRVASPSGGQVILSQNGQDLTDALTLPATGGWQDWVTVSDQVYLGAGVQQVAVWAQSGGWNFNWFALRPAGGTSDPPPTGRLPMIRQQGKDWVVDGAPIRLRGLNLGNWLQLEFWMMDNAMSNSAGSIHDQCTLEATLDSRFGYAERERLMDIFRNSWMTDRDWDRIAALGFNVVRLPFPHNLIEDENNPYTLRPDAWEFLDRAIEKAAERGIYTILDLHGAAGSQGWEHHSGCANRNWYWNGGNGQPASHYQDRTHWLWDMIAQRYAGNGNVAAYGLLNEPWGTDGPTLAANLTSLYHTVRAKDAEHIVILHGHNATGIDFFSPPGNDVAYEMHFYPGIFGWRDNDDPTRVHIDWLFCNPASGGTTCGWDGVINDRQVPFLIGEFQPWTELGANGGEITRKTFDLYNGLGWAATAWSYKTVSRGGHSGNPNDGWPWGMITNTTGFSSIDMSRASRSEIESWFAQFATQSITTHGDILYWMNYQPSAGSGSIEAEHFIWHGGAQIEVTSDPTGGDFNAGFLDTGDWMVYRVNVPTAGNYRFQFRVASPSGGSVRTSLHNGTVFGDTAIPATGGWQTWQTVTGPTVFLGAGVQDISLYVAAGGWNINRWQLIAQ